MNTIIVLTETPVWHRGYIKHHLRNPGINMTGIVVALKARKKNA